MLGLLLCYLGSQVTIKVALFDFLNNPLTLLPYSQQNSLYDSEEVAVSSARKHSVSK
jgi:hypothetical protein